MPATDIHSVIDAVWRIESARIIAGLTRVVRDVGLAEELAQGALVAALEQWPQSGIPDNPGAWLMAAAKNRALDLWQRKKRLELKHAELGRELQAQEEMAVPNFEAALDDDIGDDLLRLVFISCHPVLATEARVALTRRLLGGLTTPEIARAFLTPEPTIAQRIVRANRTLAEAHVPFEVPTGLDRAARLSSVLEVIYLIFNEGYSATAGEDWLRPAPCEDALRLGRTAACHARARTGEETDWRRIAAIYTALAQRQPTPIVELNRAVAFAMAFGPAVGLELADNLATEPSLANYHRLPSVRAELLFRLGRLSEARAEFERPASLAGNARERDLLLKRAQACTSAPQ